MNNTTTTNVAVFLGDPQPAPTSETRALRRLVRDLERAQVPAVVFFGFYATTARQQAQIDLVVATPYRACRIELKGLDPDRPLVGGTNGRWRQVAADGTVRPMDDNPYHQALRGTYALSDLMREAAAAGLVPAATERAFFRHLDTIVCIEPTVPPGSQLGRNAHVDVVGYDRLMERLTTAGPRPPWKLAHWTAVAQHFGLCREAERETAAQRQLRHQAHLVDDYRRNFRATQATGLHEFVPLNARVLEGDDLTGPATGEHIAGLAAAGRLVVLLGPSGAGKSHLARHAAIAASDAGAVVVWVRCGEYEAGRFRTLMARATAPHSAANFFALLAAAAASGAPVVLVLDGLNECPDKLRSELLEQVAAFRRRHPGGAVLTSTVEPTLPPAAGRVTLALEEPTGGIRDQVLTSHGARRPERISAAFATPYQLHLAATCEAALTDDTDHDAALFDAYVRRLAPTETVRAALRVVAATLTDSVRTTLPAADVTAALAASGASPQVIDAVLTHPLIAADPSRVGFTHELLSRFLAAEELVRHTHDGTALADTLRLPQHACLRRFALSLERDPQRLGETLNTLADTGLWLDAVVGGLGAAAAAEARSAVAAALAEATYATEPGCATLTVHDGSLPTAFWSPYRLSTAPVRALFEVAGHALHQGLFVDEVAALIDRTDAICRAGARERQAAGDRAPITTVVAATYSQMGRCASGDYLPATAVTVACELSQLRGPDDGRLAGNAARRLILGAGERSWGRLMLAAHLLHGDVPGIADILPDLVAQAWAAGGYHLRLEALDCAARCARRLGDTGVDRLIEVLESIETQHPMLSTAWIEALAACGRIEPMADFSAIRARITDLLARPDDPDSWQGAAGMVSMQFENDDIVGPYSEAIDSLEALDRIRLLVMAARAEGPTAWRSWSFEQLVGAIPTGNAELDRTAAATIAAAASTISSDGFMLQEDIAVHLAAVRAWARIDDALPPGDPALSDDETAWRLVDGLVMHLERHSVIGDPARSWAALLTDVPHAAVDVFYQLRSVCFGDFGGRISVHRQILDAFPDQIRRLFEWGLVHREQLTSRFHYRDPQDRDRYIINTLGVVGSQNTAALLRGYLPDPDLGPAAVDALRRIDTAA